MFSMFMTVKLTIVLIISLPLSKGKRRNPVYNTFMIAPVIKCLRCYLVTGVIVLEEVTKI